MIINNFFCSYEKEMFYFSRVSSRLSMSSKRKISVKVHTVTLYKIYYAPYQIFRACSRKQLPRSIFEISPVSNRLYKHRRISAHCSGREKELILTFPFILSLDRVVSSAKCTACCAYENNVNRSAINRTTWKSFLVVRPVSSFLLPIVYSYSTIKLR